MSDPQPTLTPEIHACLREAREYNARAVKYLDECAAVHEKCAVELTAKSNVAMLIIAEIDRLIKESQ